MRCFSVVVFFFFFLNFYAQEIIPFDKLYLENDLIYEKSSDKLFTGKAGKIRKNGHIVYNDIIESGKIIKSIVYYNKTTIPAIETIYYSNSGYAKTRIEYSFKRNIQEYTHFDKIGKKILMETYENGKLTYKCEFIENKKHGKEFCVNKDGIEIVTEYINGKKIN